MRKFLAAFILFCVVSFHALAAFALGNSATIYQSIAAVDTVVPLKGYFRTLQIWTDSGSADIYVELHNNTATVNGATCIHIAPGASWQSPSGCNLAISSFHYIGSAATGKMTVAAF